MKKALVILILALFIATGAFAEVFVSGGIQTNFGVGVNLDNVDFEHSAWIFNILNSGTFIQGNARTDNVNAWVRWRFDNNFRAHLSANLGAVEVATGFQELPVFVRWSGIGFMNESNWGIGASASTVNPYIHFRTMGFYVGLSEANRVVGRAADLKLANTPIPGFYLGYDGTVGPIGLGVAFAGIPTYENWRTGTNSDNRGDSVFSWMGNLFLNLGTFGPANIRLNAALYGDPEFGFFRVGAGNEPFASVATRREGTNDSIMVLEGMLDVRCGLDVGTLNLSAGLVTNFDSEQEETGLQVAASLVAPLEGGFTLIPAIWYRLLLGDDSATGLGNTAVGGAGGLAVGIALRYGF